MEERNAYFSNNSSEVKLCHFNVSDENKRETQYLVVLDTNDSRLTQLDSCITHLPEYLPEAQIDQSNILLSVYGTD